MSEVKKIREQVVYIGQKMYKERLVAGTWGNISARVAGMDVFAVTPSGMDYKAIDPDDVVLVDLTGKVIDGSLKPSSETKMHLAIYKHRPDVNAVVHTHSIFASACAVARVAIPPLIEDLVQIVGGGVDVAVYALPGTEELAQNTVRALGAKNAVLLANHGVVGVGRDLQEAFMVCQIVEKAARIFAYAQGLGGAKVLSDADVEYMHKEYLEHYGQKK